MKFVLLYRRGDQTNTLRPCKIEKVSEATKKPYANLIAPETKLVEFTKHTINEYTNAQSLIAYALMSAAFFSKTVSGCAAVPLRIAPKDRSVSETNSKSLNFGIVSFGARFSSLSRCAASFLLGITGPSKSPMELRTAELILLMGVGRLWKAGLYARLKDFKVRSQERPSILDFQLREI